MLRAFCSKNHSHGSGDGRGRAAHQQPHRLDGQNDSIGSNAANNGRTMWASLSLAAASSTHHVMSLAGHDVEQPVQSQPVKDLGNDRV